MPPARASRRMLLALSVFLVLAGALAWSLGRRPAPAADAPAALAAAPTLPQVAAAPPPAPRTPTDASGSDRSAVPLTRLPLRLLATVVHEDPALSLATIEDLERATHAVISEGQSLEGRPDVHIAQIERERVLLDHAGVREQLVIVHVGRSPEAEANEPSPEVREYRRNLSDRLRALTDAGTHYRDVLEPGTREGLLAEGDVSPAYQDGEMIGVAFDGLKPGGVYERIGLRNGDVVTSIGGVSLGDPAATAKVLGAFASSDELSLSVERSDGSQETLSLSTADFEQAVQELQ